MLPSGARLPKSVTTSVGVVAFSADMADAEALLDAAEDAVARAKKAGKNRVEVGGAKRRGGAAFACRRFPRARLGQRTAARLLEPAEERLAQVAGLVEGAEPLEQRPRHREARAGRAASSRAWRCRVAPICACAAERSSNTLASWPQPAPKRATTGGGSSRRGVVLGADRQRRELVGVDPEGDGPQVRVRARRSAVRSPGAGAPAGSRGWRRPTRPSAPRTALRPSSTARKWRNSARSRVCDAAQGARRAAAAAEVVARHVQGDALLPLRGRTRRRTVRASLRLGFDQRRERGRVGRVVEAGRAGS